MNIVAGKKSLELAVSKEVLAGNFDKAIYIELSNYLNVTIESMSDFDKIENLSVKSVETLTDYVTFIIESSISVIKSFGKFKCGSYNKDVFKANSEEELIAVVEKFGRTIIALLECSVEDQTKEVKLLETKEVKPVETEVVETEVVETEVVEAEVVEAEVVETEEAALSLEEETAKAISVVNDTIAKEDKLQSVLNAFSIDSDSINKVVKDVVKAKHQIESLSDETDNSSNIKSTAKHIIESLFDDVIDIASSAFKSVVEGEEVKVDVVPQEELHGNVEVDVEPEENVYGNAQVNVKPQEEPKITIEVVSKEVEVKPEEPEDLVTFKYNSEQNIKEARVIGSHHGVINTDKDLNRIGKWLRANHPDELNRTFSVKGIERDENDNVYWVLMPVKDGKRVENECTIYYLTNIIDDDSLEEFCFIKEKLMQQ